MNVAVNTLFLIPGEVGGSETYLTETLRALVAGFPATRWVLVTNRENDAFFRERFGACPFVTFHPLPLTAANRYARIVAEQTALPRALRRVRPDVLWSPGYTMPAWAPCPQVVSILDMQYRTHPDDLAPLARWTTHALVSMAVRRARRILAISEFSRDEIVRETRIPDDRIRVTPLGVDPVFSASVGALRRAEVRRRYLGDDAPFLFSVAHSYPHKNLALLVNAFRLIADEIPHRLLIVGKARRGEAALRQALEAAPEGRVRRVESVPREDLVALYQACSGFVYPSLYEGFGLPLLEALAAGAPSLATGAGATREVGGDAAFYADGRDVRAWSRAMLELARLPPAARDERVAAGRTHAARFTWSATAALTHAALADAAEGVGDKFVSQ
jgi:glycosyltransferase involved in cell wall biosynthesis